MRTERSRSALASVLVVDDVATVRELIVPLLAHRGYEAVGADSERDALARTNSRHFDVVVSDLVMPHLDGVQLAEIIRSEHPNMRFVFVSGGADLPLMEASQKLGPLLAKPFDGEDLVAAVRSVLREKRLPS